MGRLIVLRFSIVTDQMLTHAIHVWIFIPTTIAGPPVLAAVSAGNFLHWTDRLVLPAVQRGLLSTLGMNECIISGKC